MFSFSIETEVNRFAELRRRIMELHPDIEEQTLLDTLEGATNLREAIEAVICSALEDEHLAQALKTRIEQMRARFSRLGQSAGAKRQAAGEAMEVAGLKKLLTPEFTASIRQSARGVVISDENEIPADYWLEQPLKLDKASLREVLLSGLEIPGATLSDPRNILSVRTA